MTTFSLAGQGDYNAFYRSMNPAPDSLADHEKIEILEKWLTEVEQQGDPVKVIHGNMYLANSYYRMSDFETSMRYLITAEELAKETDNILLLGRIWHKIGAIRIYLENHDEAIASYKTASNYHLVALDSQYMGITYEQLGTIYSSLDSFGLAKKYYKWALPLVFAKASRKSQAVTLANLGKVYAKEDSMRKAITSYEEALSISYEIEDKYYQASYLNDLGKVYLQFGEYEKGAGFLHRGRKMSQKYKWPFHTLASFDGLAGVHEGLTANDSALYYHHLYDELEDSILGPDVRKEIERSSSEKIIKDKEEKLLEEELKSRYIVITAGGLLSLLLIYLASLYGRYYKNKRRLESLKHRLLEISSQAKNRKELDPVVSQKRLSVSNGKSVEFDFFEQRILKTEDWVNFKSSFDKSFPGFIIGLRTAYPQLSESEERLFILIKLRLTTKEIANILGIKSESVKKTRTRLRKRLSLGGDTSLDKFIRNF